MKLTSENGKKKKDQSSRLYEEKEGLSMILLQYWSEKSRKVRIIG